MKEIGEIDLFIFLCTCHSHMSHWEEISYRVGEEDVVGQGGAKEGQGEDHQGAHQVHQVIATQGQHQTKY